MIDLKIINLAANTTNYGLKKNSTHYASCKNRICGDKIKVEVNSNGTIIKNMRYETESCIFCQASASLLSKKVKNIMITNLDKILFSKKFKSLLSRKYITRRECIMLPFEALKKAL